jgi:hypothetical protein
MCGSSVTAGRAVGWLIYSLTPWSLLLLEKLTGSHLDQEIPRILRNPKVHYRSNKCSPIVPILSQFDRIHIPHPTSWRSILILSSHLRLDLPSDLFSSGFPTKTLWVAVTTARRVLRLRLEERLPIWRVAVNVLNKQSRTAERIGPQAWRFGEVLTTPHCNNWLCYERGTLAPGLGWHFVTA